MLRPGSSRSGKSRSIIFLTISVLLAHAAVANAVTITTSGVTSLPITVSGTKSADTTTVSLAIIQDPNAAAPPTGSGGATNNINITNQPPTTWQTTLNLLDGPYRLRATSNIDPMMDAPAEIDITVAVANNPGFLDCVIESGAQAGKKVQAPLISWTPTDPNGPSVNFNFKRSSSAGDPELATGPTDYPVGTDFTCTQDTGGRTPRLLIFGSTPLISTFAGWSVSGTTLTARMESVAATLPDGTVINSAIAGLFAQYNEASSGTLFDLTGSYLAANASFSFGFVFSGGSITALSLELNGPTNSSASFKAFFPNAAVNAFFPGVDVSTCFGIPAPTVSGAAGSTPESPAPISSLGCGLGVTNVTFASPATVTVSLQSAAPTLIPTLSEWVMILLALLLAAQALRTLHKQRVRA